MKRAFLLLCLALSTAAGTAQELKTTLQATDSGKFLFESYRATTWWNMANQKLPRSGKVPVPAELFLPDAADQPVPAMIILHGTAGVQDNSYQMAKELNRIGVAALVLDSFTPRGVKDVAKDQSKVLAISMVADAYAALSVLATHPKINAEKIGVTGFSKGGSVAYYSLHASSRKLLAAGGDRFALHIGFYPGCVNTFERMDSTGAPLILLLGGADNYTGAAPCQTIAEQFKRDGADVTTIVYDGAHHAWDISAAPRNSTWDVSYVHCRLEHRQDGSVIDLTSGESLDSVEKSVKAMHSCGKSGITFGRNDAAYRNSMADFKAAIQRHLSP
jgi:dienelactone hydrolase